MTALSEMLPPPVHVVICEHEWLPRLRVDPSEPLLRDKNAAEETHRDSYCSECGAFKTVIDDGRSALVLDTYIYGVKR